MFSTTMRALTFDGPATDASRTHVSSVPRPVPGPEEVLIRVTHAGINFKDVMMRRGDAGYVPAWPVIPGLEIAGVVEQCGEGVETLEVGTRVAALSNAGGLAEYVVAGEMLTTRIPDNVPSAVAAVVPGVWATAWLLLHEAARIRDGDTVLVHSASGAVGTAVAALARSIPGVDLLGVVGAESRVEEARRAGYHHVFVRNEELVGAVRSRLGDRGASIVLDPQGTAWLEADLQMLAPTGRIVLFGNAPGGALDPIPAGALYAANAAVGGFSIAGMSAAAPARVRCAMETVLSLIAEGSLVPELKVTHGLGHAAALHQQLADGSATTKHVIEITS